MSDEKKPLDDLKEGLGLLYRAAKGAAAKIPTEKIETTAKGAVKEVGKAVESLGSEVDKLWSSAAGLDKDAKAHAAPPAQPPAARPTADGAAPKKDEPPAQHWDDAYAPEPPAPPKGPRIG